MSKKQTPLTLLRNRLVTDSSMYPQHKEYINTIVNEIDNELLIKEKNLIENSSKDNFNDDKFFSRIVAFLIIVIVIMAFMPIIGLVSMK